jgi:anti-sigma regulatory factor (Ser/Thr protein kinase)
MTNEPEQARSALELYLPASEEAIRQARLAVDQLDALSAHPETRFTARLLVSELFANSVKYGAGSRVRLSLEVRGGRLHVEIGDRGRGFDLADLPEPDLDATSGRGLAFLEKLAVRWGVARAGETRVWFELDLQ